MQMEAIIIVFLLLKVLRPASIMQKALLPYLISTNEAHNDAHDDFGTDALGAGCCACVRSSTLPA